MTIPITGQPVVPDLSDPDTFNTKSLNMFTWIMGSMLTQFNNVNPADFFAIQSGPMDATASRVLITGAGGLLQSGAGPLLAAMDATTIPGSLARFDGTTTGTKPAGVASGTVLTVRGAGTNNLSQLVLSGDGLQLWFRACVAGVFSAWRQPTPPELTQAQAEDPASTIFGTLSGQRLGQAIRFWDYISAETTLPTASTVTTFAHGRGAIPSRYEAILRCKTAEFGYSVNDEIPLPSTSRFNEDFNGELSVNATNIYLSKSNQNTWVVTPRGGGAPAILTSARWRIVVRAKT